MGKKNKKKHEESPKPAAPAKDKGKKKNAPKKLLRGPSFNAL